MAVLETTVHDNYVKVTKRMGSFDTRLGSLEGKVDGLVVKVDGLDRKFHARFEEWGSGWTNTMNLMMEEMKVSSPVGYSRMFRQLIIVFH